jgi:hypothetical protein
MPKSKIKIYKANPILKQKIGSGPIDKKLIERAQKVIEENDVDFSPLGLQFLNELEEALVNVESHLSKDKFESQKQSLTKPVMELKANAKMFRYGLVGELASIMLNFLESITSLDKDALSIIRGHHDTLRGIINNNLSGDGGQKGQVMIAELKNACARYYKKQRKSQD